MIRRILIWLRNFIDNILWKTSKHPHYTISGNTLSTNTYGIYLSSKDMNNIFNNCTATNTYPNGLWFSVDSSDC